MAENPSAARNRQRAPIALKIARGNVRHSLATPQGRSIRRAIKPTGSFGDAPNLICHALATAVITKGLHIFPHAR
jgi:hypothetical protein